MTNQKSKLNACKAPERLIFPHPRCAAYYEDRTQQYHYSRLSEIRDDDHAAIWGFPDLNSAIFKKVKSGRQGWAFAINGRCRISVSKCLDV